MASEADRVVHARVLSGAAAWDAEGRIWTTYELEVIDPVKGAGLRPGDQTEIRQIGGTVGDVTCTAPGIPHFEAGEEAVLFTKDYGAGWQSVHNAWQGRLRVERPAPAPGGLGPARPSLPDAPTLFRGASADLDAFKASVRAALSARGR
jgi:hypothetical protein